MTGRAKIVAVCSVLSALSACFDFGSLGGNVTGENADSGNADAAGVDGSTVDAGSRDGAVDGSAFDASDASDSSVADAACRYVVFVSASNFLPVLGGGVDGGDILCTTEGVEADAGSPVYRAWLSTTSVPAASRLKTDGPWCTPSGQVVANNRSALPAGILHVIDETLTGSVSPGVLVWTGKSSTDGGTCENWSDASTGVAGMPAMYTDARWTDEEIHACYANPLPIVCFGDAP